MLKITRKQGERVFIGEDIVVEYLGLNKDGEAILGLSAPKRVRILREELAQRLAARLESEVDNESPDNEKETGTEGDET